MKLPAASGQGIEDVLPCHSARDAESIMEGKAANCILLRPDPYPLDSRFHGNDVGGYLTAPPTPPQGDGVSKKQNNI